ncbi:TPA: hypothetical protein ACSG4Z_004221 [Escherichia coli]|uniref:hypothetical protein n=1 Tax=Escherichia coli TaxID=562 RepID=UPI000BE9168B|nr:hypothetical protein [Escherichia coli]EFJ7650935.1 hypothetical protein [Escherichia coli]MCP8787123.1 hypothetical protein [Escherichia coli]
MKLGKLLTAATVLTVTACAGKAEKDPQYVAAEKCADFVIIKSKALAEKGISGKYVLTSKLRTTSTSDGPFTSTKIRGIPYATSTFLDNGNEGSAWRKCMGQKL